MSWVKMKAAQQATRRGAREEMGRLAKPLLRWRAARGFDPLPLRMDSKTESIVLRLMAGFVVLMGAGYLVFIVAICYSVLSNKCS